MCALTLIGKSRAQLPITITIITHTNGTMVLTTSPPTERHLHLQRQDGDLPQRQGIRVAEM